MSDVRALSDLGHQVTVHTIKPWKNGTPPQIAGLEKVEISRPGVAGALRWPLQIARRTRAVSAVTGSILKEVPSRGSTAAEALACIPRCAEIASEIEQSGADVAHLFWSRHTALVFRLLAKSDGRALKSAFVGAYDLVADDFLTRMALEEADIAFSHAEANRSFVETRVRQGTPIRIIRRGIPTRERQEDGGRKTNRWVTASALVPEKNVAAVIRAFSRAFTDNTSLELVIFGEGPERPELEKLCEQLGCASAVSFRGHVDREQLFEELSRAGIFLFMSVKPSERLPNVLKEAMWCGCGVVTAPSIGIEELVPDTRMVSIVDPASDTEIDIALRALMAETDAVAAKRREISRRHIETHFSARHSMEQYVSAWQDARGRLER